ncbi:MAG: hypothetical protein CMQ49_06430 [Gammaproteobacteria bacterium]|nr:hypothetical protein [Gammaproteobacteria bacterium]|tara:strand:- start:3425 stop:3658 length:234 start_codon:yes stop_codon:yes gene_type:complete
MGVGEWLLIVGLGGIWLGWQIVWASPALPRQIRRGEIPTVPKGTPEAFGLFWMDQYGYIGLALLAGGLGLAVYGGLS